MRYYIAILSLLLVFSSCEKDKDNTPTAPVEATLSIKSITPTAGTTLNGTEMLNAVLEYNIGDDYDAANLYEVSLMLKNTSGGWEFGGNNSNSVEVTAKSGTVTLQYDIDDLWNDPDYMHPFTIHFDLAVRMGAAPPYTWGILAYSEEVVYAN